MFLVNSPIALFANRIEPDFLLPFPGIFRAHMIVLISGKTLRIYIKAFLMVRQHFIFMHAVMPRMFFYRVVADELFLRLPKRHQVAELDRLPCLPSHQKFRMVLENAEDSFRRRNRFSVDPSSLGLPNYPRHLWYHSLNFAYYAIRCNTIATHVICMFRKPAGTFNNPIYSFHQRAHFFIHLALRAFILLTAMRRYEGKQGFCLLDMNPVPAIKPPIGFLRLDHQPGKYSITIPQQVNIRRIMNITLTNRAVYPQRLPAHQILILAILQ